MIMINRTRESNRPRKPRDTAFVVRLRSDLLQILLRLLLAR